MNKTNRIPLLSHLSMFTAEVFWGFMAPITKDAIMGGVDSISIVSFRVSGAALLFWVSSLFVKSQRVPPRDIFLFAIAAIFGIVTNQCLFTIGIGYTSPINASIVTTSMPIFAMVLSFLILKEPITWKKAGGVALGFIGALVLVLSSASAASGKVGDIRGDLMCLGAQLSFALYLSLFNPLVRRYDPITVNKWMFTFATFYICPFTAGHVARLPWTSISAVNWLETAYVVVIGTFVCYLLSIVSQRVLRPTVVSIYNYVQPVVSVIASVLAGIGVFTFAQALAIILVFSGVWMVTKSKSKRDIQRAKTAADNQNARI
ncbi:MAG: DMT family transporter [Prevotella sp.]|jgi:drug/metabolite transporter (DMT)-like permease